MSDTAEAVDMKGITHNKRSNRYRVQWRIKGRVAYFGEFLILDEALEVRDVVRHVVEGTDMPAVLEDEAGFEHFQSVLDKAYEYLELDPVSQAKGADERELNVRNPVVKDLIAKVELLETNQLTLTRMVHELKRELNL